MRNDELGSSTAERLLKNRVAIVTGAGRGVGRAIALELARQGAKVVVNDPGVTLQGAATEERPADEVVREIHETGGEAVASYESVADFAAAGRIVATAVDSFGTLDVLVNNAGIVRDRTLAKMTEEDFDAVVAVHLKGTFNTCRHAIDVMRDKNYGRIVNMTSLAGLKGNFGQVNYSAAKAGIVGFTLTAAMELRKHGITVNAFSPRATTRMTSSIPGARDPVTSRGPETAPEHNAALVAFLVSERAGHVTGQVFGKGRPGPGRYAYVVYSYPREIAEIVKPTPWAAAEIADRFDEVFASRLQDGKITL
jgi:NAD(P)-dependent dehydrogenase (short-subunit alcohol dehydrogenase family)